MTQESDVQKVVNDIGGLPSRDSAMLALVADEGNEDLAGGGQRRRRSSLLNREFIIGSSVVGVVALVAIVAPLIAPFDPLLATASRYQPPSLEHWFGTDQNGSDIFSRAIYAPRVDLVIAFGGTALAAVVGAPLGMVAGLSSNWLGETISRVMDVVQAFPFFVLAICLLGIFGPSTLNLILVIATVNFPIYARLLRSQTESLRGRAFIEAARVAGSSERRIMGRHILPNAGGVLSAQISFTLGMSIIMTAGVSFVGAGVRPPTPEWGVMIGDGAAQMFSGQWWPALFPGLILAVVVVGFGLMSNGISRAAVLREGRA